MASEPATKATGMLTSLMAPAPVWMGVEGVVLEGRGVEVRPLEAARLGVAELVGVTVGVAELVGVTELTRIRVRVMVVIWVEVMVSSAARAGAAARSTAETMAVNFMIAVVIVDVVRLLLKGR